MRIDAVTTCVGPTYIAQLAKALPIWLDTLDSLTIVTDWKGSEELSTLIQPGGVARLVATNAFTENGAYFNKGKALNVGLSFLQPPHEANDWLLSFDADIIPPANWRTYVEERAEIGCIHTCGRRYSPGAKHYVHKKFRPVGFFQLWHASDERAQQRPLFTEWHNNASGYDIDFAELWPQELWRRFDFTAYHQGSSRTNWYGTSEDPVKQAALDKLMREHLKSNHKLARRKAANAHRQ